MIIRKLINFCSSKAIIAILELVNGNILTKLDLKTPLSLLQVYRYLKTPLGLLHVYRYFKTYLGLLQVYRYRYHKHDGNVLEWIIIVNAITTQ